MERNKIYRRVKLLHQEIIEKGISPTRGVDGSNTNSGKNNCSSGNNSSSSTAVVTKDEPRETTTRVKSKQVRFLFGFCMPSLVCIITYYDIINIKCWVY